MPTPPVSTPPPAVARRLSVLLLWMFLLAPGALRSTARAQQPTQSAPLHRFVPQPEVEAAARQHYRTDCPFSESRYEPSPMGRPRQRFAPAHCAASGAPARTHRYGVSNADGVSPEGLPFSEAISETGRRRRRFTDGFGSTLRSVADPGGIGARTLFSYDALGRLTRVEQPEGALRTYRYSARGLLRAKATPEADGNLNGDPTDENATAAGDTAQGAADTHSRYDRAGALRFRQDAAERARGELFFQRYDPLGRPTESGVAPLPEGMPFRALDALRTQSYPFERDTAHWRSVRVYDGAPDPAAAPWSRVERARAVLRAPGALKNVRGRLAATARRSGSRWQIALLSYDARGRVAERQVFTESAEALQSRILYDYDLQGRLTYRRIEVGHEGTASEGAARETFHQWYTYDRRGLLAAVYAATGPGDDTSARPDTAEVRYRYTPDGQVARTTYRNGRSLRRTYDAAGRLTAQGDLGTAASAFAAQYEYLPDGTVREARFYQPASPHPDRRYQFTFHYDGLGRLQAANYSGGAASGDTADGSYTSTPAFDVRRVAYDRSGNLLRLHRNDGRGTPLDRLRFAYGAGGHLERVREGAGPTEETPWDAEGGRFGYDAAGRLTEAPAPYALSVRAYDERGLPTRLRYPFDPRAGAERRRATERRRYTLEGQRYLRARTYRLSCEQAVALAGPLACSPAADEEVAVREQIYDVREGGAVLGGFRRRLVGRQRAGWRLAHWALLTPGGAVIGRWEKRREGRPAQRRYYYVKDRLGSVRAVLDGAGRVVETRDYFPFGQRMPGRVRVEGTTATREDFTAHEREVETGLLYAGARYYMPAFGRWVTPDPLADAYPAWSPYNYSLNNPTGLIDPDGRAVSSPIYDRSGNLLGTDEEGLQGKAIVMNKKNFEQGMSHDDAKKYDLGKEGPNGRRAKERMDSNYESLSSRPDYDGQLTFGEAVRWYNQGAGKPLYVDARELDLTPFNVSDIENDDDGYINTFRRSERSTGAVYGTIKITLINRRTGKVRLGGDDNYLDRYDFTPGSFFGKVARSWPGSSENYRIFCYVCTNSVSIGK